MNLNGNNLCFKKRTLCKQYTAKTYNNLNYNQKETNFGRHICTFLNCLNLQ